MKKARFLALASLCSVLAGMPANAGKIKDSGAKKIGGVETQVSKESPNGKNKNEFENGFDAEYIKKLLKDPYVEWVLGVLTIGGTHEGLSYFKGKPGRFYEIPARFSLTGYSRKRKELKLAEEEKLAAEKLKLAGKEKLAAEKLKLAEEEKLKKEKHKDKMKQLLQKQQDLENDEELKPIFQKIRKSDPQIIVNHNIFIANHICSSVKESRSKIVVNQVVSGLALERLEGALKESEVTKEEFKKISNRVNFYIYYFKYEIEVKNIKKKKVGFMLTCFPKDCNTSEVYNVQGDEEVRDFTKKFALLEPRFLRSKVF